MTLTEFADLAATYASQTDALIRAAFAAAEDSETTRCYRPIPAPCGWVVAVYEDAMCGDRPHSPGFLGYVRGLQDGDPPKVLSVGRAVRRGM